MELKDREATISRYENRLAKHGYSPQTLGWGKHGRQDLRFSVLAEDVLSFPESSVLDVGCGFADLYDFLKAQGWRGQYTGIDIVPGLLDIARKRHPGLDLREIDISSEDGDLPRFDFCICSGAMNAALERTDNLVFIKSLLHAMVGHAKISIAVDFLSSHVDFQAEGAWHTDPAWAFTFAKTISRKVILRHDYMPYEFALIIYLNEEINDENVFSPIKPPR